MSLADLRAAIDKLLAAAEARFGHDIRFPDDLYWNVPFAEATQIHRETRPDMGSVVDDTESLRTFLARDPADA